MEYHMYGSDVVKHICTYDGMNYRDHVIPHININHRSFLFWKSEKTLPGQEETQQKSNDYVSPPPSMGSVGRSRSSNRARGDQGVDCHNHC